VDDADRPIARAAVSLGLTRSSTGAAVPFSDSRDLSGATPEACSEGSTRPVLERADSLDLPTDDAGRFCVRLALASDRYVAHLEARTANLAGGLVDGAAVELPVDLALEPISLRFDPERPAVSLDEPATTIQVVASVEDDGVTSAAADLLVVLSNEAGSTLGTATTDIAGRARFTVTSESLGAPGPGELRASFAGNAQAGPASRSMRIQKSVTVDLRAPDAVDGRLPGGVPEDGIAVRILAAGRYAGSRSRNAPPGGAIEARLDDGRTIAGASSLEGGQARVVATFSVPAAPSPNDETFVRFRYVPDTPWFVPGTPLRLAQPVRTAGPWSRLPLLLAGALVLGWLVLARVAPVGRGLARASRPQRGPADHAARAHLELLRPNAEASGWSGQVVDAHDSAGVGGARVAVERRGFERVMTVAQTIADAEGRFALEAHEIAPGDELVAEGPLHVALRRPVPPSGELRVALILRRRAIVERLVRWARRRGRPYDTRPEPTPGQVRRAAASEFAIARWADAVERAAFAGAPVDRNMQAEVDRLAPPDGNEAAGNGDEPGPADLSHRRPDRERTRR